MTDMTDTGATKSRHFQNKAFGKISNFELLK